MILKSGDAYQSIVVTLGQTVGDLVELKTGLFAGDLVGKLEISDSIDTQFTFVATYSHTNLSG